MTDEDTNSQVRENLMISAKNDDDLVAMKEVIAMAISIEEAYKLARLSEEPFVEMYVDHLASQVDG